VNLDQTRAATAYDHIKNFESADKERNDRYGTLALKLPALIRSAGLCQALHFIHSRVKGEAEKPEMHLLGHLATQLKRVDSTIGDANTLCDRARRANMREYLHLTREAIATAQWYARLSKSILGVDENASLRDSQ
jgi:CRISPR-associated protein Cmr5